MNASQLFQGIEQFMNTINKTVTVFSKKAKIILSSHKPNRQRDRERNIIIKHSTNQI